MVKRDYGRLVQMEVQEGLAEGSLVEGLDFRLASTQQTPHSCTTFLLSADSM